jgi:hypothetical protein
MAGEQLADKRHTEDGQERQHHSDRDPLGQVSAPHTAQFRF